MTEKFLSQNGGDFWEIRVLFSVSCIGCVTELMADIEEKDILSTFSAFGTRFVLLYKRAPISKQRIAFIALQVEKYLIV